MKKPTYNDIWKDTRMWWFGVLIGFLIGAFVPFVVGLGGLVFGLIADIVLTSLFAKYSDRERGDEE